VIPTGDTPTAQAGIEQIDQQVDGKNIRVPSDENINNAEVKVSLLSQHPHSPQVAGTVPNRVFRKELRPRSRSAEKL
jgi:hypothetical protein